MKKLIIILVLLTTYTIHAQESNEVIHWYSFEEAIKLQKENPKKIFIDVYTDWCGYCKKMDRETFSNPVIARYLNDNFYPVKFDAEQKGNVVYDGTTYKNTNADKRRGSHELAQALLQGKMSYPSYAFLNKKGQLITVVQGYIPAPSFEPIIHFFGEDAFTNIEWEKFSKNFQSEIK